MTPKPPMKLFSPKACEKIGQWNVRTMHETVKCAQVISQMKRFNLNILGISEMRWNRCGKMAEPPQAIQSFTQGNQTKSIITSTEFSSFYQDEQITA